MQNYILGYARLVNDKIARDDRLSIGQASYRQLASLDRLQLLKLREAAYDLVRIIELEMQRADDAVDVTR